MGVGFSFDQMFVSAVFFMLSTLILTTESSITSCAGELRWALNAEEKAIRATAEAVVAVDLVVT